MLYLYHVVLYLQFIHSRAHFKGYFNANYVDVDVIYNIYNLFAIQNNEYLKILI